MATFVKALVCFTLFVGSLLAMTVQKVSLVWALRVARGQSLNVAHRNSSILCLVVVPYGLSACHVFWNVPVLVRRPSLCLPSWWALAVGIACSALEGASVIMFTQEIATSLPVYFLMPILNGVFALPMLQEKIAQKWNRDHLKTARYSEIVVSVFHILLITGLATLLDLHDIIDFTRCCILVTTILIISLVWIPALQIYTTAPKVDQPASRVHILYAVVKIIAAVTCSVTYNCVLADSTITSYPPVTSNSSVNTTTISSFQNHILLGFKNLDLWWPIITNCVASIFALSFSYASIGLCFTSIGVYAPTILSTVLSVFLGVFSFSVIPFDSLSNVISDKMTSLLLVAILIWCIPLFLKCNDACSKPGSALVSWNVLFIAYGWNGVFFDQKLLLNYNVPAIKETYKSGHDTSLPRSKVYICTTMYREADYEMERLLVSLRDLSLSKKLKEYRIDTEAHIFMDNGCKDENLQEFAKRLVVLVIKELKSEISNCSAFATPYGMQMRSYLPGGTLLVIHLKDREVVKPKKRWSQVMYLHYILRHKCRDDYEIRETEIGDVIFHARSDQGLYESSIDQGFGSSDSDISGSDNCSNISNDGESSESDFSGAISSSGATSDGNAKTSESKEIKSIRINIGNGDNIKRLSQNVSPNSVIMNEISVNHEQCMNSQCEPVAQGENDDHTYILATDADMQFKAAAIIYLVTMCNQDKNIGCACGRTHPIAKRKSLIVWHQVFEYAKDFWLVKSAQNVIGSVMCCPGCFSLYRVTALREVLDKFSRPTTTSFTVHTKDTGEDRWVATLMMIRGWKLRYSSLADNTTFCPDTFGEFLKQRKRWVLSDIANAILVVYNIPSLIRNNECFSLVYVIYLTEMFLANVVTPGSSIVLITAGLDTMFAIPYIYTTPVFAFVMFLYAMFCIRADVDNQAKVTVLITVCTGILLMAVIVWGSVVVGCRMARGLIFVDIAVSLEVYYMVVAFVASLLFAAMCHPSESWLLIYGAAYGFVFPAMHILLPVYALCNIVDQSWGTRDAVDNLPEFLPKLTSAEELNDDQRSEVSFWSNLKSTLIGLDINRGLATNELHDLLSTQRNRAVFGLLMVNLAWLVLLSVFYTSITTISQSAVYLLIIGVLYGFTMVVQTLGMTVSVVGSAYRRLGNYMYRGIMSIWVAERDHGKQ